MSCISNSSSINETFIIEPLSITGGSPTLTACTALYANAVISCSGDTQIFMGNGIITFNGNLYTNNNLTATTINASTYYSGGTNLFNIIDSSNITGGTFNNFTDTLSLYKTNGSVISVTGFTDYYTTGTTLIGNTVYFDRNDTLSAYTLDLSVYTANTYVTGVTFTDNQLVIVRNDGVTLNTYINTFTGLTINGNLTVTGITYLGTVIADTIGANGASFNDLSTSGFTAATINANKIYGNGSGITGIPYVTGGTYSNGTAIFTNNTGGTFNVDGFFTGSTTPEEISYFDSIDPNITGTTFDPDIQQDINILYVSSVNASTWVWDGLIYNGYTGTTMATTPFYLNGTTIDAGGNKTAEIQRAGAIHIGTGNTQPNNRLTINPANTTTYGNFLLQARDGGGVWSSGAGYHVAGPNTGFGFQTLKGVTSGSSTTALFNSAFGNQALLRNSYGARNTAIGALAGFNVTSGSSNTLIGYYAGRSLTTGSGNTIVGANTTVSPTLQDSLILADGNGVIKLSADSAHHLFIPTIPQNDNTLTNILVRDSAGEIKYKDVNSIISGLTEVYVTGGTYSNSTGIAIFTNNTGGTFTVSGFLTGMTDTKISSFSYNDANKLTIIDSTGGTFTANINIMTGLTVNGSISANIFYGDGSQLSGISTDNFYTTASTLNGNILSFDRTDQLSAYSVNLSSLSNSYWTSGSTGLYSIKAVNDSTVDATGDYSFAFGEGSKANASNSIAGGGSNIVNDGLAIAIGGNDNLINVGGIRSAILGGQDNIINNQSSAVISSEGSIMNAKNSIILGGQYITASTNNTVYVPNLNIVYTPTSGSTAIDVLVRELDGTITTRTTSSISPANVSWSAITSTPTTISGYGITDAYTKTEIDNKILKITTTGITSNVSVDSFDEILYDGVSWHYVVKSATGVNRRVGNISATWDSVSNAIEWVEFSSTDIGDTSSFFFDVQINLNMVELIAQPTSGTWITVVNRISI